MSLARHAITSLPLLHTLAAHALTQLTGAAYPLLPSHVLIRSLQEVSRPRACTRSQPGSVAPCTLHPVPGTQGSMEVVPELREVSGIGQVMVAEALHVSIRAG